ncbi:hypothetical protein GGF31_004432 [Allomyces arbusculus]|nr:hypothetical protein GGF31_004432 [Allomyces arbusculus]
MRILLPVALWASSIRRFAVQGARPLLDQYFPPTVDELYACVWQLANPKQQALWAKFFASISGMPLRGLYIKVDAIMKTDLNLKLLLSKLPRLEDLSLEFGGPGQHQEKAAIFAAIPRNNLRRLSLFPNAKYAALYPLIAAPFPELVHVRVDERVAAHPQLLTHLVRTVSMVELVLRNMERISVPHMLAATLYHAKQLNVLRVTFPSYANVQLKLDVVRKMACGLCFNITPCHALGPDYVDLEVIMPAREQSPGEVETGTLGS